MELFIKNKIIKNPNIIETLSLEELRDELISLALKNGYKFDLQKQPKLFIFPSIQNDYFSKKKFFEDYDIKILANNIEILDYENPNLAKLLDTYLTVNITTYLIAKKLAAGISKIVLNEELLNNVNILDSKTEIDDAIKIYIELLNHGTKYSSSDVFYKSEIIIRLLKNISISNLYKSGLDLTKITDILEIKKSNPEIIIEPFILNNFLNTIKKLETPDINNLLYNFSYYINDLNEETKEILFNYIEEYINKTNGQNEESLKLYLKFLEKGYSFSPNNKLLKKQIISNFLKITNIITLIEYGLKIEKENIKLIIEIIIKKESFSKFPLNLQLLFLPEWYKIDKSIIFHDGNFHLNKRNLGIKEDLTLELYNSDELGKIILNFIKECLQTNIGIAEISNCINKSTLRNNQIIKQYIAEKEIDNKLNKIKKEIKTQNNYTSLLEYLNSNKNTNYIIQNGLNIFINNLPNSLIIIEKISTIIKEENISIDIQKIITKHLKENKSFSIANTSWNFANKILEEKKELNNYQKTIKEEKEKIKNQIQENEENQKKAFLASGQKQLVDKFVYDEIITSIINEPLNNDDDNDSILDDFFPTYEYFGNNLNIPILYNLIIDLIIIQLKEFLTENEDSKDIYWQSINKIYQVYLDYKINPTKYNYSKQEIEAETKNYNIILAQKNSGRIPVLDAANNLDSSSMELLKNIIEGIKNHNINFANPGRSKKLTSNNKLNGVFELKEERIRLFYRWLPNNTLYLLDVIEKKTTRSIQIYKNLNQRLQSLDDDCNKLKKCTNPEKLKKRSDKDTKALYDLLNNLNLILKKDN